MARDVLATPVNVKRVPIPRPISGRATRYAGVDFRSRLEARWARMFDAVGWRWQYEPDLDTPGYIPDFLLLGDRPVIVEVGAVTTRREYERKAAKGLEHRRQYDYLVVGVSALPAIEKEDVLGLMDEVSLLTGLGLAVWHTCSTCGSLAFHHATGALDSRPCGHFETGALKPAGKSVEKTWRRIGNAAQWRPR